MALLLTVEDLRLTLDHVDGELFWKTRPRCMFSSDRSFSTWNSRFSGVKALCTVNESGYKYGSVFSKKILAHRAIWAIEYGYIPQHPLDHINNNSMDNRLVNLRPATNSQNQMNKYKNKNNRSGFKGVDLHKSTGKFRATIRKDGKQHHIGLFSTKEQAYLAYMSRAEEMHGEFKRFA